MKYLFNNIEFEPDGVTPLIVNGEIRKVKGQKPLAVLKYLLDHNGQLQDRDDILAAVWGPGEHSFSKLTTVCARINRALKGEYQLKSVRNKGYYVDVELSIVKPSENLPTVIYEQPISDSKPRSKRAAALVVMSLLFMIMGLYATFNQPADITPDYAFTDIKPVFTRDYAVTRPLFSPDGKYVAHQISKQLDQERYLAITALNSFNIQKLAKVTYGDGLRWHPTGDRIVYQTRIDNKCEIRLIDLNQDKSVKQDKLLTECSRNSGELSFAWFNQNEFYFNAVDGYAPGLPLHQLYSFNVDTKEQIKVLSTESEGGVGFYSLEYDFITQSLYMLKVNSSTTSDVYRYKHDSLSKLANFGQLIRYYGVANEQFIYVNNRNELIVTNPIKDFANHKILLPSVKVPVSDPSIVNNQLTFVFGQRFGFELHKYHKNHFREVNLGQFIPQLIAEYRDSLIFNSGQTGINQIHLAKPNGEIKQVS